MKVRPSVKKICEKCKVIKRKGKNPNRASRKSLKKTFRHSFSYFCSKGRQIWRNRGAYI